MSEYRTLPLGVDLGSRRIRVACLESNRRGDVRVIGVSSRDLAEPSDFATTELETADFISAILEQIVGELGVRERRCVAGIDPAFAVLRVLRLPPMSWGERLRVGRFEAQRFVPWDMTLEPSIVRVHPVAAAERLWAIGVARVATVESRLQALRGAGLQAHAIDSDALALRRVLPLGEAIVDVGAERTTLHIFTSSCPRSWVIPLGGDEITRAIAGELAIDLRSAERRKRIVGVAGAGGTARERLSLAIAEQIDRAQADAKITRVALTGNGARLPGLLADLERATGAIVEIPVPAALQTGAYPEDVVRMCAPDWTLAAGLASWRAA